MQSIIHVRNFLRGGFQSRFAWLFMIIHGAWFFLAIANMSPPSPDLGKWLDNGGYASASLLAGRPFHLVYESIAMKLLILADLPSLFASIPLDFILSPLQRVTHFGTYAGSYVGAALLLLTASFQWLAIGKVIESRIRLDRWQGKSPETIKRSLFAIIVFVVVATCILTPIVNARSRQLGFRHAAISFH
jgi:hypothetical protein